MNDFSGLEVEQLLLSLHQKLLRVPFLLKGKIRVGSTVYCSLNLFLVNTLRCSDLQNVPKSTRPKKPSSDVSVTRNVMGSPDIYQWSVEMLKKVSIILSNLNIDRT